MMKKKTMKKLGLASLLFSSSSSGTSAGGAPCSSSSCSMSSTSSAWQWPSCKQPRTLSFRQQQMQTMMKTMNSAYSSGCFSNSSASRDSLSSATCSDASASADAVGRALRSDRLFFDPDASVLKLNKKTKKAFGGATAMSMESSNPYSDFRASMEAMVRSHHSHGGGKQVDDWRWLEEMLGWYLRANVKSTHGLIVAAFIDLLVSVSASSSSSSTA
ncbi:transcription repressor OFP13-like [Oryza brachyantha]|uniref:transcription repressor OFP13-like n=1 Tax=Oryza brachyantha TaxID=4533 RepID=UPI001ADC824E|nr:transcription repressor OFP13-like [Oryza brachyantha]